MAEPPSIDYLAKDFASFRQLMLDRLSATLPSWQERHLPDLGITIVEILAYVADYLSYFQDAVATEGYLGTARQRISVRRHAKLLDYVLHEGCNARAWVALKVSADVKLDLTKTKIELIATTGDQLSPPVILSGEELDALPQGSFETFLPLGSRQLDFRQDLNKVRVVRPLARGDTRALLDLPDSGPLKSGSVVIFEEAKPSGNDAPGRAHAVRLAQDPIAIADSAIKRIVWSDEDAIPHDMGSAGELVARGNVVLVDHGCWVSENELQVAPDGVPRLSLTGVTYRVPWEAQQYHSATAMVAQDCRKALPVIQLFQGDGSRWDVRADLLESWATDRHFCAEVDDEWRVCIRFGDGECGEQPEDITAFASRYRIGNGPAGNVPARAIKQIVFRQGEPVLAIVKVFNPLPATGGTQAENKSTARLLAPADMHVHQKRAVSPEDYETFTKNVSGVEEAAATIIQQGARRIVRVAVKPRGIVLRRPLPAVVRERWGFLKTRILERLETARRINHEVAIVEPSYVELIVAIRLVVFPSRLSIDVLRLARLALTGVPPGPGKGSFFHPDNLSFGQPIHWSELAELLHLIPGIASVQPERFGRKDAQTNPPVALIEFAPQEIPYLDDGDLDFQVIRT
jgi:hypothetical protein